MPKKTLEAIVESGNEYVVQVKQNQPSLLNYIKTIADESDPIHTHHSSNKGRGRDENRDVSIYSTGDQLNPKWVGVNRIIQVKRYGYREQKPYFETHYFMSSLKDKDASVFAFGIRNHWHIENRLHWVKDVIQNEDRSRVKDKNTAAVLSAFRQIAINIFRLTGNDSIKKAHEKYCNRLTDCLQIIKRLHIDFFRTV